MSENLSMTDRIYDAISKDLADFEVAGIPTSFLLVGTFVAEDGVSRTFVVTAEGQDSSRSLGLVGYAEEWIRDDIRAAMAADFCCDEDE